MDELFAYGILTNVEAFAKGQNVQPIFTGLVVNEKGSKAPHELTIQEKVSFSNILKNYPEDKRAEYVPGKITGWDELKERATMQNSSLVELNNQLSVAAQKLENEMSEIKLMMDALVDFEIKNGNAENIIANFTMFNDAFHSLSMYKRNPHANNETYNTKQTEVRNSIKSIKDNNFDTRPILELKEKLTGQLGENNGLYHGKKFRRTDPDNDDLRNIRKNRIGTMDLNDQIVEFDMEISLFEDYLHKRPMSSD